ncbi:MAG: ribosome biogenesis GTPase Der [Candidatus Cardinium sp.]|nr:ribosome biogenesis GTPase Der [Candidatus Cardinium sp.]
MANIVAIVGKSNVGKSTLFNRLVEKREAITDSTMHTTRDRHYGVAQWSGKHFTVIDTGGYIDDKQYALAPAICEQIQFALQEASAVFFMVDAKEGLTALDQAFANIVRSMHKPVLLIANKTEHATVALSAASFYALGLGKPFLIAAINGSGTGDLLDALLPYLKETAETEVGIAQSMLPKIALIGRPNVGKSSFLNSLLGEKRHMVSPMAGTTRDATAVYYNRYHKQCIVIDTAGVRKKSKVGESIEFYAVLRAIKAIQDADICLVMLDAQSGLEAQDMALIALAQRYKKGMVLVVNKWDLVDKTAVTADAYKKYLLQKMAPFTYLPILLVSALQKQRMYQTLEKALTVYHSRAKKIPTAELNRVMLPVIDKVHPPAVKGKFIKIKYCTQVKAYTPIFAFFCNYPQYVQPHYISYLEKQIRANFDFEGVPIQVIFKKK